MLRLPDQSDSGVVGEVVRVVDLVPTILESAGIETPEDLDGESLLPLVRGADVEPRIGYAEALNTLDEHAPARLPEHQQDLLYAVVDQQWKLIYHQEVPTNSELYNLGDDPREQINVIDQHPEEAKRLLGWLSRSGAMELELVEPEGPIDPEALQKLEALGYLQTGN